MRTDAARKSDDAGASIERSHLFSPGTVVSETCFRPMRSATDVEPERQLMVAVLEDAVRCVRAYGDATDRHGRELFLSDMRWMLSDDRSSFFSFENICETLGLDAGHVREATLP